MKELEHYGLDCCGELYLCSLYAENAIMASNQENSGWNAGA